MKQYVYVLELQGKRHYVGLCLKGDPYRRIRDHYKSNGARFTQKHKVVKLIQLQEVHDPLEELIVTLKYMHKHCVNNVRGDKFVQEKISEREYYEICKLMRHLRNDTFALRLCGNVIRITEESDTDPPKDCEMKLTFPASTSKIMVTLRCMETFGFSRVISDIYNSDDHELVCVTLRHANQQCVKCGDWKHFAKSCPFREFQTDPTMFRKKVVNEHTLTTFCQEVCEDVTVEHRGSGGGGMFRRYLGKFWKDALKTYRCSR